MQNREGNLEVQSVENDIFFLIGDLNDQVASTLRLLYDLELRLDRLMKLVR